MNLDEIAKHFCVEMLYGNDSVKDVHHWFDLSYAQYLTVPRSALQSMPPDWQKRFIECLNQLDETIDWRPKSGRYLVRLKDNNGIYRHDPLMNYERGRRDLIREGYNR